MRFKPSNFAETDTTKRFAAAATVVKDVVKKHRDFGWRESGGKAPDFAPKKVKNKAENESFSALFGLSDWT